MKHSRVHPSSPVACAGRLKRARRVAGLVVAGMATLDPYAVGVAAPSDVTGAQLIELVQRATRAGTMANITFHGIGGDYLSVSRQAHEELLNHLAAHRDTYWTDTFINIMRYVKAQRALKVPPLPASR